MLVKTSHLVSTLVTSRSDTIPSSASMSPRTVTDGTQH